MESRPLFTRLLVPFTLCRPPEPARCFIGWIQTQQQCFPPSPRNFLSGHRFALIHDLDRNVMPSMQQTEESSMPFQPISKYHVNSRVSDYDDARFAFP